MILFVSGERFMPCRSCLGFWSNLKVDQAFHRYSMAHSLGAQKGQKAQCSFFTSRAFGLSCCGMRALPVVQCPSCRRSCAHLQVIEAARIGCSRQAHKALTWQAGKELLVIIAPILASVLAAFLAPVLASFLRVVLILTLFAST